MNAKIDISSVILKKDDLILRKWKWDDLYDFNEYASVKGVGEMAGWKYHQSLEETELVLNSFILSKTEFAIEKNSKVIGSIGLNDISAKLDRSLEEKEGIELGFVLSKDYWNKGIMKDALEMVIDYLFKEVKLSYIVCGYFKFNERSKKLQKKLGFKYLKSEDLKSQTGKLYDRDVNLMTIEEWQKSRLN